MSPEDSINADSPHFNMTSWRITSCKTPCPCPVVFALQISAVSLSCAKYDDDVVLLSCGNASVQLLQNAAVQVNAIRIVTLVAYVLPTTLLDQSSFVLSLALLQTCTCSQHAAIHNHLHKHQHASAQCLLSTCHSRVQRAHAMMRQLLAKRNKPVDQLQSLVVFLASNMKSEIACAQCMLQHRSGLLLQTKASASTA